MWMDGEEEEGQRKDGWTDSNKKPVRKNLKPF